MKRKPGLLIGLASAILTFGVLMVTVGKPSYYKHFQQCQQAEKR